MEKHALAADIRAYEKLQDKLELEHMDEYALLHEAKFVSVFPDFDTAARYAIDHFGQGPYLIRRIGRTTLGAGTAIHLR